MRQNIPILTFNVVIVFYLMLAIKGRSCDIPPTDLSSSLYGIFFLKTYYYFRLVGLVGMHLKICVALNDTILILKLNLKNACPNV